jgi:hypothetical protein
MPAGYQHLEDDKERGRGLWVWHRSIAPLADPLSRRKWRHQDGAEHGKISCSDDPTRLIHHPGRGSNYVPLTYTDRILELGGTSSIGSTGDSYDNALAESQLALFKTELTKTKRPWRTVEEAELATRKWARWCNN